MVEDTTNGHQGCLPKWHSKEKGVYEATRRLSKCNMWASGNMWWEHFCPLTFTFPPTSSSHNSYINNMSTTTSMTTGSTTTMMANSNSNNDNWGSRCKCVLSPQYVFFFTNMLTYAQGFTRHNASDWLQGYMWRFRRVASWASQVSFLLSSTFFSLLIIISKWTMCIEQEWEPQWYEVMQWLPPPSWD